MLFGVDLTLSPQKGADVQIQLKNKYNNGNYSLTEK